MEVQEENNKIGSDIGKEKRCKLSLFRIATAASFARYFLQHSDHTHTLEDTKAQGVMFLKCSSLSRDLVVLSPFKASKTALQSAE